ncbi:hypothetical protein GEMRC1_006808 [Eukaryota sp. GEM-RC1]
MSRSYDTATQEEALFYSRKHHLTFLMQHLLSRVLLEQPANPRQFLVEELDRLQSGTGYLFNIDSSDLETLYKTLVQTHTPPKNLLSVAMRELGFSNADIEEHQSQSIQSCEEFVSFLLKLITGKWSSA